MISSKYIGFITILVLVILSSGCLSTGVFVDELNMGDNSGNFTELNKTANGTYSAANVSFKCPDNWLAGIFNGSNMISIYIIQINDSSPPQTQIEIDIIPNKSNSEQEAINEAKKGTNIFTTQISSDIIVIDGNKAHDTIFLFNDPIGKSKFEQIYFVKNGRTYLITFSAANKNFDKEKANFDMILKSFKVHLLFLI